MTIAVSTRPALASAWGKAQTLNGKGASAAVALRGPYDLYGRGPYDLFNK